MGLGELIIGVVKRATKALVKIETKVDDLLNKLQDGCPPPSKLQSFAKKKNTLLKGVSQVLKLLETLTKTGKIVQVGLTGLQLTTRVIKVLPVPTSYPPGAGIPIGVITTLSDLLDFLSDKIRVGKGIIKQIGPVISLLQEIVGRLQQKFELLDTALSLCLETANLSPEEKELISQSLNVSQDSSSTTQNVVDTKTLENSLEPNSLTPYFYGEWRFIIDKDIKNKKSYPRRRIIAIKGDQKLFGEFSFSSSTDILVDEMKFRIDNGGQTPLYYIGETIVE